MAVEEAAAAEIPGMESQAEEDRLAWEAVLDDLKEEGKDALSAADRTAAFYTRTDGITSGVIGDVVNRIGDAQSQYGFSESGRQWALEAVETMKPQLMAFAGDTEKQTAYAGALALSSALFWAMALMVGTVQGGIQALSRSYFGKLIPPERSNEFFGFYDIFGKFASVVGPLLYSVFYMATGRASVGIISLLCLFGVGGIMLTLGRKHLPNHRNPNPVEGKGTPPLNSTTA